MQINASSHLLPQNRLESQQENTGSRTTWRVIVGGCTTAALSAAIGGILWVCSKNTEHSSPEESQKLEKVGSYFLGASVLSVIFTACGVSAAASNNNRSCRETFTDAN